MTTLFFYGRHNGIIHNYDDTLGTGMVDRATVVIYFQDSFCRCLLYSFTCDDSLETQGSLGSYIPKYFVLIRYFVSEKASFLKCIPYIHVAIFIFILNVQSQMSVMQMSPSFNYRIVKPLRLFNQLHSVPCMDVCPPHNYFWSRLSFQISLWDYQIHFIEYQTSSPFLFFNL